MSIDQWSSVAANNASGVTGVNFAEGQAPSSLNDSCRAIMADVAAWYAAVDPAGRIEQYGGSSVPSGWLECDGSAVSRATYARLFAAISTTWGAGDGSTTFNVPDFRGRTLIGKGTGSGLTARALAATGGEENHTLTQAELPTSTATIATQTQNLGTGGGSGVNFKVAGSGDTTGALGSGTGHNTMQPFAVTMFIIRT